MFHLKSVSSKIEKESIEWSNELINSINFSSRFLIKWRWENYVSFTFHLLISVTSELIITTTFKELFIFEKRIIVNDSTVCPENTADQTLEWKIKE